jgi:alkylation response protein AidB-like acyl-CoA dehydrogenase
LAISYKIELMDFSWPEEYLAYKERVISFASTELSSDIIDRDYKGEFSRELWEKCGAFGLLGLASEPQYGGSHPEIDVLRATLAMQGFGYGCLDVGLGIAINAHLWAVQMSISKFGSHEQKQKFLPKMTSGEWIGAHGLSEDDAGSDVYSLKTSAKPVDGGYILNGHKRLVTLAPICDVAVVFANTNPELGKWGITAFLVEADMPGFTRLPVQHKMGLRTVPIGRLQFEDCFVPRENILGQKGAGWSISGLSLEYDRCCILSAKLGAMEKQVEMVVEYAKKRKQFGQSINNFQAVSHRIASMKCKLEIAKLLLYKMAWMKQNDMSAMLDGAILKLFLSESYVESSLDAIRIFGGSGYLTENGIERGLRDAIGGIIYAGTSDIQKNIIASYLGL